MESRPLLSSSEVRASRAATLRLYASAVICSLTPLSYGVCLGYTAPAFPDMKKDNFITDNQNSWFGALLPLAAMTGAALSGKGIERLGRKTVVILTALPFIAGWIAIACSALLSKHETPKIVLLFGGRILTGIATGSGTVCSPTYLAEISPKEKRGVIGSLNQLFATMGIEFIYILGYFITSWEWLAILSAIPPVLSAVLMLFCPESPRWLVSQNRDSDAMEALTLIRDPGCDVLAEVTEARESMTQQESRHTSGPMFRKRSFYVPLIISLGLNFFQQFSGINAIMFNAQTIFKDSGFTDSALAMIILGGVNVLATVLSVAVIDRLGRRILLNAGGVGMLAALVTCGAADYSASNLSGLSLAALLCFIVSFAVGFGPIPWLMTSEVFPNHCRGVASAIASNVNWICCFIITKTFQDLQTSIHSYGAYWFYACFCLMAFFFTMALVPETKGVSLESIERDFEAGSLWQFRRRRSANAEEISYTPIA